MNHTSVKFISNKISKLVSFSFSDYKGIMSLYALSLFTERQLIINMTTPCTFTQMFLPNQVNWNPNEYKLDGKKLHMSCLDRIDCMRTFDDIIDAASKEELDNDILTVTVNNDWLTYFSQNHKFKERIEKLGYSTEKFKLVHLFKEWFSKLFKFSPSYQTEYDSLKQKLSQGTELICAQIRIGGPKYSEWQFNAYNVTKVFFQFVRDKFLKDLKPGAWKLLVLTEMEEVQNETVAEFGLENMFLIPGEFSHMDHLSNLGNDCSKIQKSILEFSFMQHCDKTVVSFSGFGKLGVWNRELPVKDTFVFEENEFKEMSYDTLPIG